MDYFPLFTRLTGTPCLVVGGGDIALRKIRLLLRAAADITLVAPQLTPALEALVREQSVTVIRSEFDPELVTQFQFIVAATSDPATNRQVAAAAATALRFCNVVDDRELSTAIVPAIVDRSPVIIAVSTGGNSPVLATRMRQQIEQLVPASMAGLADFAGRWRHAVQETLGEHEQRLRFWQDFFDGNLPAQVMQGETALADQAMQSALTDHKPGRGEAWIVGAGPGDPELLTLKAARILRSADVIMHDRLVSKAVLEMARRDAEFIPVGKQGGKARTTQEEINATLVRLVQAGNRVCRLKGGDPFVFGRGGEEIEALDAAGLPWQVVPGITAASGCAAAIGLPLTHRNVSRSLIFATAHTSAGIEPNWAMLSHPEQTVVFYMAVGKVETICAQMMAAGRAATCPAVIVENGSTDRQRVIQGTLATLPQLAVSSAASTPALLIVGEVAARVKPGRNAAYNLSAAEIWSATATE